MFHFDLQVFDGALALVACVILIRVPGILFHDGVICPVNYSQQWWFRKVSLRSICWIPTLGIPFLNQNEALYAGVIRCAHHDIEICFLIIFLWVAADQEPNGTIICSIGWSVVFALLDECFVVALIITLNVAQFHTHIRKIMRGRILHGVIIWSQCLVCLISIFGLIVFHTGEPNLIQLFKLFIFTFLIKCYRVWNLDYSLRQHPRNL